MAVTLKNTSNANSGASLASSLTFAHTVDPVSNLLVVTVGLAKVGGTASNVSSVTYNGQALTNLGRVRTAAGEISSEIWYMLNPPVGQSYDVVVTLPATHAIVAGAHDYAGVNPSTPFGPVATAVNDSALSISANVTSAVGDLVIDSLGKKGSAEIPIPGAGEVQTYRAVTTLATATDNGWGGSCRLTATGASTAMSWSHSTAARQLSLVGVAIRPYSAGRQFQAVVIG